ncbi:hypothetical protein BZA05DRAFT_393949 [Tricharina praecox]|uniref:uncharacterized protein n=1 Tax=Tricharina praecox TaxID=43433 RepID=UPI00221ED791|nr:uncharacterized protein BZA05DRAFT_393949 [Tricharina praecox]KAI5854349.1 hypothetical protein BZA05DRAFT_393949 [Tricharina praecox]
MGVGVGTLALLLSCLLLVAGLGFFFLSLFVFVFVFVFVFFRWGLFGGFVAIIPIIRFCFLLVFSLSFSFRFGSCLQYSSVLRQEEPFTLLYHIGQRTFVCLYV